MAVVMYETPHLIIRWDELLKCVHLEWHGFVDGEAFRQGLNRAIEIVRIKGARHWLADLREERVIPLEDQTWFVEDWYPRVQLAGIRYMAVLEPSNLLGQMSIYRMRSNMDLDAIQIVHFATMEEARVWLQSCK